MMERQAWPHTTPAYPAKLSSKDSVVHNAMNRSLQTSKAKKNLPVILSKKKVPKKRQRQTEYDDDDDDDDEAEGEEEAVDVVEARTAARPTGPTEPVVVPRLQRDPLRGKIRAPIPKSNLERANLW